MEYIYGAMLLNSAGKEINEANLSKVVDSTGEKADAAMIKAVCASLDGVDIEKTISEAAVAAPAAAAPAGGGAAEEKKEEKKEEDTAASAGLGALFG
jgi:large subunit ribosomal protein L12|tara:strand:+ start:5276 stop:5566 length:291 start_codon:yes stop_codon:yes gene_type:complete